MILVIVTAPDARYVYLNCRFRKAVRDMCVTVSVKWMYSYLKTVASFLYFRFMIGAPKILKTDIRKLERNKRIKWCKLQEAEFLCLKLLQTADAWVHMKEACLRRYSRYENLQCLYVTCISAADFVWEYNVRDTSCNLCNVHSYTHIDSLYTCCNLKVRHPFLIYEQINKQMTEEWPGKDTWCGWMEGECLEEY